MSWSPARQWQAHSALSIGPRTDFNLSLFHVGEIRSIANPAYIRADVNLIVRVSDRISVSATGQNLLTLAHTEFIGGGLQSTASPRTAAVQFLWRL